MLDSHFKEMGEEKKVKFERKRTEWDSRSTVDNTETDGECVEIVGNLRVCRRHKETTRYDRTRRFTRTNSQSKSSFRYDGGYCKTNVRV